jgi:MEMO1 family protein
MSTAVRQPAVAGRFYPRNPEGLRQEVESYLSPKESRNRISALGCVIPHAGYMYSGPVAGAVYSAIELPQSIIILCPNHTGLGRPLAIMSSGVWETPLGAVPIDSALAASLKQKFPLLTEDSEAHRAEHAIEVQLPFLQALRPDASFVPVAVGTNQYELLAGLGVAIGELIASRRDPVLIIASSDMNHYESDQITRVKDQKAIDRMLTLDARGLFDVVMKEDISMCGYGPAVSMLTAANCLGARRAELIKYATSGDVSGDRRMVVGYAGIAVQ